MKKTLLSIAFVAAGIFGFSAMAQQPCCNPAQACCEPAEACCQTPAPQKGPKFNALEGITLTADQQTAVNALNEKYAKARKDKAEARAQAQNQEINDFKEGRRAYLKEMQEILTPEQYTTFLENLAMSQPAHRVDKAKGPRSPKGKKDKTRPKDKKGPRNKKPADAPAQPAECCE